NSVAQTLFNRSLQLHREAHPGFVTSEGRVSRGFDDKVGPRAWQAEQILKVRHRWPPKEGELIAIQIDQDSPPPPPPLPKTITTIQEFREQTLAHQKGVQILNDYLTQYTGQMVVFRARKKLGQMELEELNPDGPFR